jgi:hypothetical protein
MQSKQNCTELGAVFNSLISDYSTLRLSLNDIDSQSQNIRICPHFRL